MKEDLSIIKADKLDLPYELDAFVNLSIGVIRSEKFYYRYYELKTIKDREIDRT